MEDAPKAKSETIGRRIAVTITLSEAGLDALRVLSLLDMRSKSLQVEYLIFEAIERRGIDPYLRPEKLSGMLNVVPTTGMTEENDQFKAIESQNNG